MSSRLSLIIYGFRRARFNKCRSYVNANGIHRFIIYRRFLLLRASAFISFLPSFVLLVALLAIGRSVGLFASRLRRPLLPPALLILGENPREIRRIKNHECISRTDFLKSEPINGADDLTRFEFHLKQRTDRTILTRYHTRTTRRPKIYDEIKKKEKEKEK